MRMIEGIVEIRNSAGLRRVDYQKKQKINLFLLQNRQDKY